MLYVPRTASRYARNVPQDSPLEPGSGLETNKNPDQIPFNNTTGKAYLRQHGAFGRTRTPCHGYDDMTKCRHELARGEPNMYEYVKRQSEQDPIRKKHFSV